MIPIDLLYNTQQLTWFYFWFSESDVTFDFLMEQHIIIYNVFFKFPQLSETTFRWLIFKLWSFSLILFYDIAI